MRKIISTLLLSLMMLGLVNATVIFDPATFTGTVPAGMKIVDTLGAKYLRVVLAGWGSEITLPSQVILSSKTSSISCKMLYAKGTDTTSLAKVQICVKESASKPSFEKVADASAELKAFTSSMLKPAGDTLDKIQVWGQSKWSWAAITGGIVYLSKIESTEADPNSIFDPSAFMGTLPAGMAIVDTMGGKYLRVVLNGWNSNLDIPSTIVKSNATGFSAKMLYKNGTDTFTASKVKVCYKESSGDPSFEMVDNGSATLKEYKTKTKHKYGDTITKIQFFGQETYGWSAVTGGILYVGKIMMTMSDPKVMFDPATFDTTGTGYKLVVDGTDTYMKIPLNEWNTFIVVPEYKTESFNQMTYKYKLDLGTSGFAADKVQVFVQPGTGTTGSYNGGAFAITDKTASITYKEVKGDAKRNTTITAIQFAGQETVTWGAIKNAFIYIGKITLAEVAERPSTAKNTYSVPYLPAKDIIISDGKVEADEFWKSVTASEINRQALPASETPKVTDSKGTFKASWDEDYLYLLIDAIDPNVILYDNAATDMQSWNNDGTELFVDMRNRHFVGQARISTEQHQLRFNVGREKSADTSAINFTGAYKTKYKYGAEWGMPATSSSWRLEVQLPWANLCRSAVADSAIAKFLTDSLKAGKKIAFEVSIINATAKNTRVSIMNWANDQKSDQAYNTNEFYGELVLAAKPAVSVKSEKAAKLSVSPNPAVDVINVTVAGLTGVEIYSILGQKVASASASGDVAQVNVSSLKKGAYIVKASANGKTIVAKIVKK